jgi:hypothetical protein
MTRLAIFRRLGSAILSVGLVAMAGSPLAAQATSDSHAAHGAKAPASKEEAAVRAAVNHYLMGHATGDGTHHRMVFHPESKLFWIQDGQLRSRTSEEYIAGSPGKPAADEAQRKRWIEAVDVTGDAAIAKVVLDYPTARLTDYFTLLKVDGQWKIVNKIFTRETKPTPGG